MATTPDGQHGQVLFLKRCARCHGVEGWGNGIKEIPAVAGQRDLYIISQLAAFETLERNGSAMHRATQTADIGNPQAIRDLAAFLSKASPAPNPDHGDGRQLATGEKMFQSQCALCHGAHAEGSPDEPIPSLAGQHYSYIMVQLKSFAEGHRGQVEPPVIDFTAGLSMDQRQAIADYLSRLQK